MRLFHERLQILCESLGNNCAPFQPHFVQLANSSSITNSKNIDELKEQTEQIKEAKLFKQIGQLNSHVLKVIEELYKKYLDKSVSEPMIKKISSDNAGSFALECLANLIRDVELLDPKSINRSLNKLSDSLTQLIHRTTTNSELITRLIGEFRVIKAYLDIFETFANKWCVYLVETNLNTSKLFIELVNMFLELKKTGLSQPPEFDDKNEEDGGRSKSDKFDTSEAAGLGEGEGARDVSDQIENEDQLDDAKTKEEREKENSEEKDEEEEKIKDEEKGIEMSEDFEAKMDNVEKKEDDQKEDDEGGDEEEEEIDDQKASVDDPMDVLDKQLWDENGKGVFE